MILLLLTLGCGHAPIPDHLRPDPAPVASAAPVTDLSSALSVLLRDDPLARRADPGPPGRWSALPGGAALEAWAVLARRPEVTAQEWAALAERNRGTAAVAMARGAALAMAEAALEGGPNPELDRESDAAALAWFTPLVVDDRPPAPDARPPMAWLSVGSAPEARLVLLTQAERHVMLGWLDGPEIPLAPVAQAFLPGVHDALMAEPVGALILARGRSAQAPERAVGGRARLREATVLALSAAAADRDAEQAALAQALAAARAELGAPEGADPVAILLAGAREDLTADAADPLSAGLALVALTAERLHGPCAPGICRDFDRGLTLARAEVWGAEVGASARVWQIIALKEALDTFEVTQERPSFASGLPELIDALLGTGSQGIPATLLRRRHPGPQLFLDLTRAAEGPDATDAAGALAALKARLVQVCDRAAPVEPETAALVARIRARAAAP